MVMRQIHTIEQVSIAYLFYFMVTLYFSPDLFEDDKTEVYKALLKLFDSQQKWIIVALVVSLLYIASFIIKKHSLAMLANAASGCFFLMLCVTYIFIYPNVPAGVFLFVSIKNFHEVFKISNRYENKKADRLKKKMNCKRIISNSDIIEETEGGVKEDGSEQTAGTDRGATKSGQD